MWHNLDLVQVMMADTRFDASSEGEFDLYVHEVGLWHVHVLPNAPAWLSIEACDAIGPQLQSTVPV